MENNDMVNKKTDGPSLLTEALCMVTREENCTASLLTPLLWKKLPFPLVCFMHHQASVTLIDTLWNSLKHHFCLKTLQFLKACREDSQAMMGIDNHKLCTI